MPPFGGKNTRVLKASRKEDAGLLWPELCMAFPRGTSGFHDLA